MKMRGFIVFERQNLCPQVGRQTYFAPQDTSFGGGAFQMLAPTLWNSLDFDLRKTDSLDKFRK
jgi:hypothetical protein